MNNDIHTQFDYLALVDRAKKLSHEYYVLSQPSVSDADFDALVARIEETERQHPEWIVPDSPTQQVGSDLSANGRRLVIHRSPMLSCQKASTNEKASAREKLEAWMRKTEKAIGHNHFTYTLEWKYDGISCSLIYHNGRLISAATRGDGRVGQDITSHAQYIQDIPQRLQQGTTYHGRVEVRGEIVMPTTQLALTADSSGKPYTDCRTAASSLCNQQVPDPSQCALLMFRAWDYNAPLFSMCNSHYECMSLANWMTFKGQTFRFDAADHAALFDCLEQMEAQRTSLPFPVDGLVVKVDDKELAASLGATAHHPHGSIAYKFPPQKAITRCTHIEMTVGASGRRTPVAYFEPVVIMGREVKKASLSSEKTARDLGIAPGATIEVGLANDVRPTVYRVIDPAENQNSHGVASEDAIVTSDENTDALTDINTVEEQSEKTMPTDSIVDDVILPTEEEITPIEITDEMLANLRQRREQQQQQEWERHFAERTSYTVPATPTTADNEQARGEETTGFAKPVIAAITGLCVAVGIAFTGILAVGMAAFALPLVSGSLMKS